MTETVSHARLQTTTESFGGPWATSVWLWFVLLIPALILSGYQDSSVPYPTSFVAALAAIAECAAGILPFVVVSILRRRTRVMPLAVCLLFWSSVGVIHGLASGLLVAVLSGVDPHYLARVIFWAAACLIWMPLTTYAIAQFADRRELLTTLAQSVKTNMAMRAESALELAQLRSLIVTAMRDSIRPVVVEIAHSLEAIGPALDAAYLTALGDQLTGVADETSRIIATTSAPAPEPETEPEAEPLAPLAAALDFQQDRPIRVAPLTGATLLPMIVASSFASSAVHIVGLGTTAIVLAVAIVVMAAGMAVPRLRFHRTRRARLGTALAVYCVAGISAAVAAYFGPWQPMNRQNEVLALLLLIAVPFAAIAVSAAVGLGTANLAVVNQINTAEYGRRQLDTHFDQQRSEVREQLTALTHGPLLGRLAACAMALNFHAAEIATSSPERTRFIATSVLDHLADALLELDSLG